MNSSVIRYELVFEYSFSGGCLQRLAIDFEMDGYQEPPCVGFPDSKVVLVRDGYTIGIGSFYELAFALGGMRVPVSREDVVSVVADASALELARLVRSVENGKRVISSVELFGQQLHDLGVDPEECLPRVRDGILRFATLDASSWEEPLVEMYRADFCEQKLVRSRVSTGKKLVK